MTADKTLRWAVKLTCDKPVGPKYAPFAGVNLIGPFETRGEAEEHRTQLDDEFMRLLAEHGAHVFVYGPPKLDVEPLWAAGNLRANARNWVHLDD